MIEFLLEIPLHNEITGLKNLFLKEPKIELHIRNQTYEFIAWGDPIDEKKIKEELHETLTPGYIVSNLYGHYYYILLNKSNGELFIGNSMFSILPLYYYQKNDSLVFSENAISLGRQLHLNNISRRFILETILFNYPLFNHTIFEDINLLPSNSYCKISCNEISIIKHTKVEEYFSLSPRPWRKSLNYMRDVFLEKVGKYLPDKKYAHALTGGFDGRTLVSTALWFNKSFSCYCFGSSESRDTLIASQLARKADITFKNIELGIKYVLESSLINGREFIENASGTATFARAHYLYAAKGFHAEIEHIVTGNFGSEIFRAAHIAGAVISKNLFTLFNSDSPEDAFKLIEEGNEFRLLNKEIFHTDWESLKTDMLELPCYNQAYSGLTQNQKFYVFVFEEMFRKYFGAEMVNQFRYIKNRTPFLDIDFIREIFKTELAGIHSGFFEHNPLKRYKGQILYAHIIKKAYPDFGKLTTDKGYKPDDLLNLLGKINIAKGYSKKITRKSTHNFDPYAVNKAWETNRNNWLGMPVPGEFFDLKNVNDGITKDILFKILSLSYCMQSIR